MGPPRFEKVLSCFFVVNLGPRSLLAAGKPGASWFGAMFLAFDVRELPQGYSSLTFPISADWAPALVVVGPGWSGAAECCEGTESGTGSASVSGLCERRSWLRYSSSESVWNGSAGALAWAEVPSPGSNE